MLRRLLPLGVLLILSCSDDAPPADAGTDAGELDLGVDAGLEDVGLDAGLADAEPEDSGPPPAKKRVFVTAAQYNGNLGGILGGDTKCQIQAQAAQLDGTWKAWLSSAAENAVQRMADVGPWVLVDGTTEVFASRALIADGPQVPLRMTAAGNVLTAPVWTGTLEDGTASPDTCQSWTSGFPADFAALGSTDATDAGWTSSSTQTCSGSAALYCFEQ